MSRGSEQVFGDGGEQASKGNETDTKAGKQGKMLTPKGRQYWADSEA